MKARGSLKSGANLHGPGTGSPGGPSHHGWGERRAVSRTSSAEQVGFYQIRHQQYIFVNSHSLAGITKEKTLTPTFRVG